MAYIVSDIIDVDGGEWGRAPEGEWPTREEALAAAQEFVDANIDAGDYGQTPIRGVAVKILIELTELDEEGDEIDDERIRYTAVAGGDVEVSAAAERLYERITTVRYSGHIDDEDRQAADELVAAGIARWTSEEMSDTTPGLRPGK